MPNESFQLTTVTRRLTDNVELAEVLGFSEISAFEEHERKWRACLQAKARLVLEDPVLSPVLTLHRRRIVAPLEPGVLDLTFDPPRRSPDWEQPVLLRIHFVQWTEEDLHHAFVPGLGIRVFTTRADLVPKRVESHVRLLLAGRRRRLSLRRFARLSRIAGLRLGTLEVTATRKTPKQIATTGEASEEKKSILNRLAEELPPVLTTAGEPAKAALNSAAPVSVAFELDSEVQQLAGLLAGPHRRSVLIVGLPGCGKTAMVHELARRRKDFGFGHTRFWSTSGARLMTGPIGFGMWQERCLEMCRELSKTNAILHLNNLGELLEVGKAARGDQSVGSFLRTWIARGEVLAIAECTPEQISALEREEPHLLGAFHPFEVPERTPEQTRAILRQVLTGAPGKNGTDPTVDQAALLRIHQLHQRYATYSANPGRPLRFLKNLLADRFPDKQLDEARVIAAFSVETGLPAVLLDDEVLLELSATREWFARRVMGQSEAVERVVDLLALIKARLARPRKPLASLLFIGPTGTGKTELAKALAGFLFGDPARLVRFDLNEFTDAISVQRLIGGAATGPEGLLTARIREQPFSVVLLDELEALESELSRLKREVFRHRQEQPDDMVLACYSEHRPTLMGFAQAYSQAGARLGKVMGFDYFLTPPGGRSSTTKLLRETPKKLKSFFASPPEKLIGIVMHLRGDLFAPRFQPEAGLHVIKEKRTEHVCLIETASPPFESYEAPTGIERQGAIAGRGASVCRTYRREDNSVRDGILGERPWTGPGVSHCVQDLTEQRLNRAIEAVTR